MAEAEAGAAATAILRNHVSWDPFSWSLRLYRGYQLFLAPQSPLPLGAMFRADPGPWSPRSPTSVCMLHGGPCGLRGLSSPFPALCSRHRGPELVCDF